MRKKQMNGKLTPQQHYLLQRVPSAYQMNGDSKTAEPLEVKKARRLVEQWEKQQARRACETQKRNEALRRKAQEAVYFDTPEKALAIIRQCEKMLKGCDD